MKYYIQVLSKWYAFVRIFISCQIFFSVVNKKGLRGIFNIIRTFKLQEMELDNENPLEGILTSTMFAIRSTMHTTTQHRLS